MSHRNRIPEEKGVDHTISLIREGYMFISNRCHSFNSPLFKTRILGKKTICMVGKEAAEIFYDTEKFKRKGVAPNRAKQTLFGTNSVQTLDGAEHEHRKNMLTSVMTQDKLDKLMDITKAEWKRTSEKWMNQKNVLLYEEAQEIMCQTACQWVGIQVQENKVKKLSKDLGAMYESAGAVGPNHWRGRHARNRIEKWIMELVDQIRKEKIAPNKNTIFNKFAQHRDLEGNLLNKEVVAVEIINLLRPIVAISIYISFIALAIHHYPKEREKVKFGDEENALLFVQEVRRYYPFFPFVMAEVKQEFIWNGYQFDKGTLTLLDLYGTNHDSSIWDKPDQFLPERFMNWKENPYNFIPQGGGDYFMGHRCAGEWVTTRIMKVSLDYLVNQVNYKVPDQDLSFSMVSMPSIPRSKVILENVQL